MSSVTGINEEYVLNKIKPYIDGNNMISEKNFNRLFSKLDLRDQYKIINVLINNYIDIKFEDEIDETDNLDDENRTGERYNEFYPVDAIQNLTNEQLCVLYQKGLKIALDAIISKNVNLVKSRAVKYLKTYRQSLEIEDLIQAGFIGMIKAVERFDHTKGVKFITYATGWIDQAIRREIMNYGFLIRIPVHYFDKIGKVLKMSYLHPEYSFKELFREIKGGNVTESEENDFVYIMENVLSPVSLNYLINENGDTELIEFVTYEGDSDFVENEVEDKLLRETLNLVLSTLKEREKSVLQLRFGLDDGQEKTLEEIGKIFGVTRERIRQIESKAIKKLRHHTRSRILKDFVKE
ncbi:MAG: sigma-70 family RNA polymerase sigma factor [Thermoanaerobacteraceae bacterium]